MSCARVASSLEPATVARASRLLRYWLGSSLAASVLLATRLGQAQPANEAALPVALDLVTNDDCTAERFRAALATRVRRPLELREDAAAKLRVRVTRGSGTVLAADATFEGASGNAQRVLRGSCSEITAALALVAATWLEAEPRIDAASPPAAPAAAVPPPPPALPPPGARPVPSPPRRAAPAGAAGPRKPYSFGGHAVASVGLVSSPAFGAALAFAYEGERFELRAGLRGALGTDLLTNSTAHHAWLTAPIDGCMHALTGRALRLAGCARIEPGYLHVQFADIVHSLPWLAIGAGARVGWNVGPVRLEIEGFAELPVSGYRINRAGTTFVPFRAAAGSFGAGFMVPFS